MHYIALYLCNLCAKPREDGSEQCRSGAALIELLNPLLPPPEKIITPLSAKGDAKALFQMHIFHIGKNFTGCAHEKKFMSCWRLQYQGTRSIVAVRFDELYAHMKKVGCKELDYQHVWAFLHKASYEDTAKCSKACDLFHGSVGPGELLQMPYGASEAA